jgi:hypothetical protein
MTDTPDTSPERIWANPDHWIEHPPRRDAFRPEEYAEYVRVDLCDPMQDERVKRLVQALRDLIAEYERGLDPLSDEIYDARAALRDMGVSHKDSYKY